MMIKTTREITFIENLLCELKLPYNKLVILNVDSEPARVIAMIPFFFFLFEADFIQLVVLNLSHLNYIKLCLFLTSNER